MNIARKGDIMQNYITSTFPPTILNSKSDYCISIYMPTHRTSPDNKQDAIRFKNIVDKIEDMKKYDKQVKILREIQKDTKFWIYNLDGLVILMDQEEVNIYRLPRSVQERVSVGERFYLKPLIRNFQSDDRYYALALSKDSVRLFSGNRYGFIEVELDEEESLLDNVLGTQHKGKSLNVVSHGGIVGNYHGHGARSEEVKVDTKRFFTHVDRYISKNFTDKYQIPLILIGVAENQPVFRDVSQNDYLLKDGINRSIEGIKAEELSGFVWELLEPVYVEKTNKLVARYHEGLNNDTASHSIHDILKAIVQGRVHILVIEDGKTIPGSINLEKVDYKINDEGEDILNQMAQMALEKNMEVVMLPKERMPKNHGIFAIFRY